jgi:hypothetical protein
MNIPSVEIVNHKFFESGNSQMESDSIKVGTNDERVSWQKVKWIQILKSEPESIFFNYNFNCENFIQVNVKGNTRKLGRPAKNQDELPPRYSSKLAISAAKEKKTYCVKVASYLNFTTITTIPCELIVKQRSDYQCQTY